MENIIYRKSNKDDLPQIAKILKKMDLNATGIEASDFMVAAFEKKILGCARIIELGDNIIELASVAVVGEYRNQGIGSKIIKALLNEGKRRPVYLMCRKANQLFYEKCGFKEIFPDSLPKIYRAKFEAVTGKAKYRNVDGLPMIKE
jgi:N-acetylglutamate synthase-like GNAT family acetyltransferase